MLGKGCLGLILLALVVGSVAKAATAAAASTGSTEQQQQWCTEKGTLLESQQQWEAAVQAYQECSRNTTSGPVAAWSMYRAFNVLAFQIKDNQRALAACTAGWDAHNAPELAWCAGFVSVYLQQHSEAKEWAERAVALGCFNGSCDPLIDRVPADSVLPVQSCSWEGPLDVLVWANKGLGDTAGAEEASQVHSQAQQARLSGGEQTHQERRKDNMRPESQHEQFPPNIMDNTLQSDTAQGVVVAHRGISWWVAELGPHWTVPCTWQGQPLACEYVSTAHAAGNDTAQALLRHAQAIVHEGCWDPAVVPSEYQDKLQVMFNMEPHTATTQCGQLDYAEMTYRSSSQVWSPYWAWHASAPDPRHMYSIHSLHSAPVPTHQKLNAIAYINGNCKASNGRQDIVRQLHTLLKKSNSSMEVHSYGKCDPNVDAAALADFQSASGAVGRSQKKLDTLAKYKFCVAMENSVIKDYVSEKLYDALVAGCVPIYLGAPNIADFVPEESAIINYAQLGSPQALQAELERLTGDEQAYAAKLEWKTKDTKLWNAGFQQLLAYSEMHPSCHLCCFVAEARKQDKLEGHAHCSANTA